MESVSSQKTFDTLEPVLELRCQVFLHYLFLVACDFGNTLLICLDF